MSLCGPFDYLLYFPYAINTSIYQILFHYMSLVENYAKKISSKIGNNFFDRPDVQIAN